MALRPENPGPGDGKSRDDPRAAQQDVFLREVDDALREDQLRSAVKRWGMIAGGGLVAALLALGGFLYWQQQSHRSTAEQAEQFTVALDNVEAGKLDDAATKLAALARTGGSGSKAAAQLMEGGIAAEQGKTAAAVKLFEAVAADGDAPQVYRDLAVVRAVAANFDALKPEDVIARLKPLAEPGKPWFGSAGELVGLAYMKQGKNDLAGPLFAAISRDKETPESLRSRSRQMAGLLGVDAIDDVARAAGTVPGQN
ncbi:MAG: tetratricopeptide repeat protein [Novosphingobium sp.]